jgi:hypothetical protein
MPAYTVTIRGVLGDHRVGIAGCPDEAHAVAVVRQQQAQGYRPAGEVVDVRPASDHSIARGMELSARVPNALLIFQR